jgi:hypothetical protein
MCGVPECGLHVAEVLVDLVAEHLAEEADVRALAAVPLDRADDGRGPVDDQRLQPVPLVQVRIHELLHRLTRLRPLLVLLIVLLLLVVNIVDQVSTLLKGELLVG